ncbi:E3 ubiquitin-protein ligase siah2-like [Centruroides sculpturatus]|uniref:E3 ubiquitin-protein ligase siah2-like n=1 Tax=Centruroides sculpturatus TaxID=218467 RepID=UPI000C6C9645|nr:E3 ubiquitin-protein ligase siah2-like [Centruroides sculpturatus]
MASSDQNAALTVLVSCPVCFTVAKPPVSQCTNGHIVCLQCRPRVSNCPTCQKTLGHIRSLITEQLSSSLRLPCRNEAFKCTEMLYEVDREDHETICFFNPLTCPFSYLDCRWEGARPNLLSHIRQTHPQVPHLDQNAVNFFGIHAENDFPKSWAVILKCYSQYFLIMVTNMAESPTFLTNVYLLSDEPPRPSSLSYFVAFKRGSNMLHWKSSQIPLWGSTDPHSSSIPLGLSTEFIYSFCAHNNFKFFVKIMNC